ncbi:hypothetical protein BJX64DRAFT_248692 [Aspergillus heterothallicus]
MLMVIISIFKLFTGRKESISAYHSQSVCFSRSMRGTAAWPVNQSSLSSSQLGLCVFLRPGVGPTWFFPPPFFFSPLHHYCLRVCYGISEGVRVSALWIICGYQAFQATIQRCQWSRVSSYYLNVQAVSNIVADWQFTRHKMPRNGMCPVVDYLLDLFIYSAAEIDAFRS